MMRTLILLIFLVSTGLRAQEETASSVTDQIRQMIEQKAFDQAVALARDFLDGDDASDEQSRDARLARWYLASALAEQKQLADAIDALFPLAQQGVPAAPVYWRLAEWNLSLKQPVAAAEALVRQAEINPKEAKTLNVRFFWQVMRALDRQDDGQTRYRLLNALHAAGHSFVGKPGQTPDIAALELIERHVDAQELISARRLTAGLSYFDTLFQVLTDRRFEPIWPFFEKQIAHDVSAILDLSRSYAASQATRYDAEPLAQLALVETLLRDAAFEQALDLATSASRRLNNSDDTEALLFLENARVISLINLERHDEALAIIRAARNRSLEDYPDMINQFINYGIALHELGRPQEAIDMARRADVEDGKYLSQFGRAFVTSVEICGLIDLSRRAEAAEKLARIESQDQPNHLAVARALYCWGDVARLAAHYQQRLADPAARGDAIVALMPTPARLPRSPIADLVTRMQQEITQRPDIQTMLQRYARIMPLPPEAAYWGDL